MPTTRMHPVPAHGPRDGARAARRGRPAHHRHRHYPRHDLQWEEANRGGLLTVHGLVGTFAGLLILFNGAAPALEDHGRWFGPLTGALAFAGGAVLLAGLGLHRVMRLEVAGLVLLAAWDLLMAGGFVASAVQPAELSITWPWEVVHGASSARLYPIAVYGGLFLMVCIHLLTLTRLRGPGRSR